MVTSAQDTSKAVISSVGSAGGGGVANSSKPVIAGTAPAGETVNIYDGVRFLGTATVAANGTWSFTPTADLKGGVHQFTAIAVDASGGFGASSTPISVSVPSSAPVAPPKPVINGMTDDNGHPLTDPTNDAHPNMSGTGVPGDIITMYDGPTPIGSTTVAGDGTWTVKPTNDLPSGNHDIYVIETNPGGVPSVPSDHMPIVVDTSVPATPAAPVLTDDNGATIPAGSTTADAHPHISGTGKAGDVIKVYDGATVIGSTTIGADGKWTFTPTTDLSKGSHDLYVTDTNPAGTTSAPSPHTALVVAAVTAVPVVQNFLDHNGDALVWVNGGPGTGSITETRPMVTGTGVVGDLIKLYLHNGLGTVLVGSAVVDATGHWRALPDSPLSSYPDGAECFYVSQTGPGLAESPINGASVYFGVSTAIVVPATPAAPVLTDDSGATIPAGSTTADAHPHISGTGTAGDVIKVYDGATVIGSTTIGADGKWTFTPTTDLSTGSHDLHVTETNAAGTPSADSPTTHITIQTQLVPATPVAPVITDHHDASIPAGATTFDTKPHISGHGTAGDTITVYDGSTVLGSVTVAGDGTWTFTPSAALPVGSHSVNVTESNAAGASGHSAAASFTLQQTSVVVTAVTDPLGHLIPIGGDISGPITVTGTVTGFADGDAVIITYDGTAASSVGNARSYITAIVTNGTFSATFTGDMTSNGWPLFSGQPGTVNLQALGMLAAGNCQSSIYLVNETNWAGGSVPAAPAVPVMTDDSGATIPAGSTTNDGHPHISGTGTAGDTIKVYDGSTVIGTATVKGDGTWAFTPAADLGTGSHSISVTETNAAGESAHSASTAFTFANLPTETVTITGLLDHLSYGGATTNIENGGSSRDTSPTVTGTISLAPLSGESLVVYRDGVKLGNATVVGTSWTYNDSNVSIGAHTYTARVEASSGAGTTSNSYAFIESTTPVSWANGVTLLVDKSDETVLPWTFRVTGVSTDQYTYPGVPSVVLLAFGGGGTGNLIYDSAKAGSNDWLNRMPVYTNVSYFVMYTRNSDGTPGQIIGFFDAQAYNQWYPTAKVHSGFNTPLDSNLNDLPVGILNAALSPAHLSVTHDTGAVDAAVLSSTDDNGTTAHSDVSPHTVLNEHDAFTGTTGHDTVDLNADPTSYFKEATAHIQGSTAHPTEPVGTTPAANTLHLTGDHQVLDLTSLTGKTAAAKISGIEVVDLGGHANTLKLSLLDVLNLGEQDLFQKDGKQQMMVNGSDGDKVDLANSHIAGVADGQWEQHGTAQVGGVMYNVYEHSGAHTELLVQQGVQIVVH